MVFLPFGIMTHGPRVGVHTESKPNSYVPAKWVAGVIPENQKRFARCGPQTEGFAATGKLVTNRQMSGIVKARCIRLREWLYGLHVACGEGKD